MKFVSTYKKVGDGFVEILLPLLTVSEANGVKKPYVRNGKKYYKGEHWREKYQRHKAQKLAVIYSLKPFREYLSIPCKITLTRYAPNKLDRHDNLPMSMKWILDACCEVITGDYRSGRADASEEIDVVYHQIVSDEYGVKINIDTNIVKYFI